MRVGRSSVNTIEIASGLAEGDQVVLSDMSAWDAVDRVRLRERMALEPLVQDLRAGARIVRTSPGVSLTAVALLALVIGGNTSVYSMINGLSTPAPGVNGEASSTLAAAVGEPGNIYFSYPDYLDYAAQTRTLRSLAGRSRGVTLTLDDGAFATATCRSPATTSRRSAFASFAAARSPRREPPRGGGSSP